MRDNHRRYRGRGRAHTDNATPGAIGWPEHNGGRVRDGDDNRRGRGDGRRGRNDLWSGGDGSGADAVPVPNPEMVQRPGRGGKLGEGDGRINRRGNDGLNAVPMPQLVLPGMRQGGRGERVRGGGEGRGYR